MWLAMDCKRLLIKLIILSQFMLLITSYKEKRLDLIQALPALLSL